MKKFIPILLICLSGCCFHYKSNNGINADDASYKGASADAKIKSVREIWVCFLKGECK